MGEDANDAFAVTRLLRWMVSSEDSEIEVLILSLDYIHYRQRRTDDIDWGTQLTRLCS